MTSNRCHMHLCLGEFSIFHIARLVCHCDVQEGKGLDP